MSLRRLLLLVLVATVAWGCASTPTKEDRTAADESDRAAADEPTASAQELFVQANKSLDQKDFEKAIDLYDQALERDEARWDIYMNKAIAHSANQQFQEAVDAIDRALAHGGDDQPEVYFNLGNIYQNRGLYDQSIKAFRTSLALRDGSHADTLVNIAAGLSMMHEHDRAEAAYEHLRDIAPDDPRAHLGLGVVDHLRQNYQDALLHYEEALDIDPGFAQAWFNKAVLFERTDEPEEAIGAYHRYLEVAPDGPYADRAKRRAEAIDQR